MPLVTLDPILRDARKHRYAVPAFDVSNYEMVRAVTDVCCEEVSPVVFMLLGSDTVGDGLQMLTDLCRSAASCHTDLPVCIHLDHAATLEDIEAAVHAGVTSVMYDGSSLPFEENLRNTAEAAKFAHAHGVTIEAELGHVGNGLVGSVNASAEETEGEDPEAGLTDPAQVAFFVEKTQVDCLAVAIGTAHGVYTAKPQLHLDRLNEINQVSPCPLVLHGGSGTPDADVKRAIRRGITKINIYSEVLNGFNSGLKEQLAVLENLSAWPQLVFPKARENMRAVIRRKIYTFGSNGQA